jgi:hypothetical protein
MNKTNNYLQGKVRINMLEPNRDAYTYLKSITSFSIIVIVIYRYVCPRFHIHLLSEGLIIWGACVLTSSLTVPQLKHPVLQLLVCEWKYEQAL